MRLHRVLAVCAGAVLVATCLASPALADDDGRPTATAEAAHAPVDKSGYTLFNPTPADQMRDFNANRPDTTEGPYTIDAGHLQIESSFAEYTLDHSAGSPSGTRTQSVSVLPTNFRIGVLNQVEADVIVNPFLYQHSQTGSADQHSRGFGDMQLRAVINFLGDDGGPVAVGLIPFVQLPTATRSSGLGTGYVQGGVIFPAQVNLPHDWGVGAMLEVDALRNDGNSDYGVDLVHSLVVAHGLFERIEVYGEYVGITSSRLGHSYQAFADTGVSYQFSDNLQVDVGVSVGLSKDTPDYTIVSGITIRI